MRADRWTALYISNHGAMVSTTDSEPGRPPTGMRLARAARRGPVVRNRRPAANYSRNAWSIARTSSFSYRTNPHVDRRERGGDAAPLMRRLLAGERFEKTFIHMPIVAPTVDAAHCARRLRRHDYRRPAPHRSGTCRWYRSWAVFAFADAPEAGISILTYGSGSRPKTVALKLANLAWSERERFKVRLTRAR